MPSVAKKHPKVCAVLRARGEKVGPLTVEDCRKLVGWTEEPDDKDWGKEFVLKDLYGKKIRLTSNTQNRPFRRPLADRYANEHIRGKWSLNLESIVIADTGSVLQGQHRLVGLILADQTRKINPSKWGNSPLVYETLVGYGASTKPANANTYDLGAKRSLGDVFYRHQKFGKDFTAKKQKGIANVLSGAVRLVWLRVGGKLVSFAPHFPHSEALEFYGNHPGILQAVTTIVELDEGDEGNEKCVADLISLSYAAGLLYLMQQTAKSQAAKFWKSFANGTGLEKGSPILSLRQFLVRSDATSGSKRDEVIGSVIKAWLLFCDDEEGSAKDIRVPRRKSGEKFVLSEFPRIGGLDAEVDLPVALTQHQLLILSVLKKHKKPVEYDALKEATGLQVGTLANAIQAETKGGKANPDSLAVRGLVAVTLYEDESCTFKLTAKGRK